MPTAPHAAVQTVPRPSAEERRSTASADQGPSARKGYVANAVELPEPKPPRPVRILVPGLDVDAPIKPIAMAGRVLTPPSDPSVIGWWSRGARPGAVSGTAILTGHTVHSGGGAFDDLELLRRGQRVRVGTRGRNLDYVVRSVTVYRKQSLRHAASRIFDQTVPGRLALVTCEDWNGTAYLSNVVVIAEPTR